MCRNDNFYAMCLMSGVSAKNLGVDTALKRTLIIHKNLPLSLFESGRFWDM